MKHITCDQCGQAMPGPMSPVTIIYKSYDICEPCKAKILKPLDGKGEDLIINRNIKFPPDSHDNRKYC